MKPDGQPTRILVIEDDPAVARSLHDGLEREGYAVSYKRPRERASRTPATKGRN